MACDVYGGHDYRDNVLIEHGKRTTVSGRHGRRKSISAGQIWPCFLFQAFWTILF